MDCKWYDVGCSLTWLKAEIKAQVLNAYDSILDALLAVFNAIPVPSFITNIGAYGNSLTDDVLFWLSFGKVPFGLGVIVAAYTLRFIVRRLPFIG